MLNIYVLPLVYVESTLVNARPNWRLDAAALAFGAGP